MRRNVSYFFLAAVTLAACTKKEMSDLTGTRFHGTWEWIKTEGGIANNIHETPQSTGKRITLQMTIENRYVITVNDAISSQGFYTAESRKCMHDGTTKSFLNFSEEKDKDLMVESVGENTLILSDEAHDGLTSTYGRQTSNVK
ncbi:MAG: hypothetical protein M3Q06_11615 [Bacteroidota bacterium]|nr:hypothetical protein [Bacteroidota bacterium]